MECLEEIHGIEEVERFDEVDGSENCKEVEDIQNSNDVEEQKLDDPVIGMLFDSSNELFACYKAYGKQKGFAVKRRTCKKGSDGVLRYVTYVCGRSGRPRNMSSNALKSHPTVRYGCEARLGGCLNKEGQWRVGSLVLEHNHDLSPSKPMYFQCNRNIRSRGKRSLEISDHQDRIKGTKNLKSFVEVGGNDNDKIRRFWLRKGDVNAIQRYFLKMQTEYAGFFFSIDFDEDGRLKNVFWADPRSRAAYKDFGDIVTFDTTYLTNRYDMPLVFFVGVNHHGQSILLGCGLISCHDTKTFTWLFHTWLVCMSGSPPIGIITDQDIEIKKAVEIVFLNTRHRWCLWHIFKKLPEKLKGYKQYESITSTLHCVIYDSLSPAIFEESWHAMIIKYDLGGNEWLSGLYDERNRWVPCFVKSSFWAGMSITQRDESMSMSAFFDRYVNSKTTLKQFTEQYDNALRSKVEKECRAEAKSFSQQLPCVTIYEMEKQVQEVYTISKFQEFQQELIGKMYCELLNCVGSEYEIREDVIIGEGKRRTYFTVRFQKDNGEVSCSCSRFQFRGILCRHAITVLIRNDVMLLPEKYILRRWRRDVRRRYTRVKISYDLWSPTIEQERYEKMCDAFAKLADVTANNEKSYKSVLDWMENALKELTMKVSVNSHVSRGNLYLALTHDSYTQLSQDKEDGDSSELGSNVPDNS